MLSQACPFTVPKAMLRLKDESEDKYLTRLGFRRAEAVGDASADGAAPAWEDTEAFLDRMKAHVGFLAAFLQSDEQPNGGLEMAWSWLSRCLFRDRLEGTALYFSFAKLSVTHALLAFGLILV